METHAGLAAPAAAVGTAVGGRRRSADVIRTAATPPPAPMNGRASGTMLDRLLSDMGAVDGEERHERRDRPNTRSPRGAAATSGGLDDEDDDDDDDDDDDERASDDDSWAGGGGDDEGSTDDPSSAGQLTLSPQSLCLPAPADSDSPASAAAESAGGATAASKVSSPTASLLFARPEPLEPPTALALPDEVLVRIFSLLEVADLASVAVTCRRFATLLQDDMSFPRFMEAKLLRRLLDADVGEAQHVAAVRQAAVVERAQLPWARVKPDVGTALAFLSKSPRLVSLDANHCREVTTDVLPQLVRLRQLRSLDLSCNKLITNQDIIFLLSSLRNLESLSLRKCTSITDHALLGLPITGRRLKYLDLRACPGIQGTFLSVVPRGSMPSARRRFGGESPTVSPNDPTALALETLRVMRLPDQLISGLVALAPSLRELTAQDARNVTDHGCEMLALLPSLKCLKLRGCARITPTGMTAIASGLPHLETLGLRGRRGCQLSALEGLSELKSLRLSWKTDMHDDHISSLVVRFPHLTKLDLSNCVHLTDNGIRIALAVLPLHTFKVLECPLITDVGYACILGCRNLEKLSIGWTVPTPQLPAAPRAVASGRLQGGGATVAAAAATPAPSSSSGYTLSGSFTMAAAAAILRRPLELLTSPFLGQRSASATAAASAAASASVDGDAAASADLVADSAAATHSTDGVLSGLHHALAGALPVVDSAASGTLAVASASSGTVSGVALARGTRQGHHSAAALAAAQAAPQLQLTFLPRLAAPFGEHLRSLRLHHSGPIDVLPLHAAVRAIATIVALEDLRLCGWPINDVHADLLAHGLPRMRTLIITKSKIGPRGVHALGDGMRRLYYLDLRHGSEVTGEGFGVFRRLNAPLHTLVLSACPKLDSAHLRAIACIQNLHWLDLSLSPVRSTDLKELARSGTLRKLVLRGCPGVNAAVALQALQGVRHLHTIDLTGCLLTEEPSARRLSAAGVAAGTPSSSPSGPSSRALGLMRSSGWGLRREHEHADLLMHPMRWDLLRQPFAKVLLPSTNPADSPPVTVDIYV